MTLKELQQNTYSQNIIASTEVDSVLSVALHKNLEYLYKNPDKKISLGTQKKFAKLLALRLQNWPLAYLRKNKDFFGLNFIVNKHTLIPRPNSELLVEEAQKYLNSSALNNKVLDMGTGSGCLIISLAKTTCGEFFASDVKKNALKVARLNARKHQVKITFYLSNLFKKIPEQKFALILANLPYLNKEQMREPSISHEPKSALFSQNNGLKHYEKFLQQVKNYLAEKYLILLEIDPGQNEAIKILSKKYLPESQIDILPDINNLDRVVRISLD